jgi:hypothetical protein
MNDIIERKHVGTKYENVDPQIASILHKENVKHAIIHKLELADLKRFDNYLIEKEIGKRKKGKN